MEQGFERAAKSFSSLVGRPVKLGHSHSVMVKNANEYYHAPEEDGLITVLITNIIGAISGKSFLIINEQERVEIVKGIALGGNTQLQDAFLLEIDNILSASVIAALSDALKVEAYGDVPRLERIDASHLKSLMKTEMGESGNYELVVCNTTFAFSHGEKINPRFIWKISRRILESHPAVAVLPVDP